MKCHICNISNLFTKKDKKLLKQQYAWLISSFIQNLINGGLEIILDLLVLFVIISIKKFFDLRKPISFLGKTK